MAVALLDGGGAAPLGRYQGLIHHRPAAVQDLFQDTCVECSDLSEKSSFTVDQASRLWSRPGDGRVIGYAEEPLNVGLSAGFVAGLRVERLPRPFEPFNL